MKQYFKTQAMAEQSQHPVPEGMHTVTPQIWFNGNCKEAIEFYQKAFNAKIVGKAIPSPDGNAIWHVILQIGTSRVMMADAIPGGWEKAPTDCETISMWLYVEDCDSSWKQASEAGCTEMFPMDDMFWGDRLGKCKDPFGHVWAIASHKWIYTPEEMKQKQEEMMAMMEGQKEATGIAPA